MVKHVDHPRNQDEKAIRHRLDRATSVNFISVSLEVARRAAPSAILAHPDLAACVIWSNYLPQGSLLRLRNRPQNICVPSCTMLARINESSRKYPPVPPNIWNATILVASI
jgi:hypothetical protein